MWPLFEQDGAKELQKKLEGKARSAGGKTVTVKTPERSEVFAKIAGIYLVLTEICPY